MKEMTNVVINGISLEESEVWVTEGIERERRSHGGKISLGTHKDPTEVKIEAYGEMEKAQLKALLDEGRNLICQGYAENRKIILEEGAFIDNGRNVYVAKFMKATEA